MKRYILLAVLVAAPCSTYAQSSNWQQRQNDAFVTNHTRDLDRERARFEGAMDRAEKCAASGYTQYCW